MKTCLNNEERSKRRRQVVTRSKFALPSSITIIAMFCSFSSIIVSIDALNHPKNNSFSSAAYLLILAGIFDGLDGRIARATNTTTEFGLQLDSLADVLSFGMAPALLAYQYEFSQISVVIDSNLRAAIWAAAFFFVACSALRLARFNIQAGLVDPKFFVGMPTPIGAACIASIVLYWPIPINIIQIYLVIMTLFITGILMVSNVRFPSFKKPYKKTHTNNWITISLFSIPLLTVILHGKLLLPICILYLLLTISINICWKFGWKRITPPVK